jgi:protoheme IX farnesyltransferase
MAFAAIPGAIPGALPIWMGYVAASDEWLAPGGLYLFALLFYWQMPHFWSLAIRFREDYAQGEFPVLPVTHGTRKTLFQIALWSVSYVALGLMAPLFLRVGTLYVVLAVAVGAWILLELARFVRASEGRAWLRFFLAVNFSLIAYVFGAAADLWSVHLIGYLQR